MTTDHTINGDDQRDFLVWRSGKGRTVEIFDIQVGSERRRGIGRRLVQALLDKLNPKDDCVEWDRPSMIYAMTRAGNDIAHQFYEGCGFRLLGRLHGFYRDGGGAAESALVWGLEV